MYVIYEINNKLKKSSKSHLTEKFRSFLTSTSRSTVAVFLLSIWFIFSSSTCGESITILMDAINILHVLLILSLRIHYPWCFSSRFRRKSVRFFVRYLFQRGIGRASIRQIILLQIIENIKINVFNQNLMHDVNSFFKRHTKIVLGTAGSVEDALVLDPAA